MDEIREKLDVIRESQIRMEQDLKYHIKRTDTLENYVGNIERRVDTLEKPVSVYIFAKKVSVVAGSLLTLLGVLSFLKRFF